MWCEVRGRSTNTPTFPQLDTRESVGEFVFCRRDLVRCPWFGLAWSGARLYVEDDRSDIHAKSTHGIRTRSVGCRGFGTHPRFEHVGSFGGVEGGDQQRRHARNREPWLRAGRVPLLRGLARLGVVDSVHTKSTIPWRPGNY